MSAYKTESAAKTQASKKHGKNWAELYSLVQGDEGWEIVAKELETELPQEDAEELEESMPQNGSICSSLFGAMINPVEAVEPVKEPKKDIAKTTKVVEQNRVEQNGLKRPSKGSTCAIIWDTCDKITLESEATCTSAALFGALQGYNECTLRTQYARWRQFNGITGRLPGQNKPSNKLPVEFADVIDGLSARISEDKPEIIASLTACKTPAELVTWMSANFINF